MSEPNSSSGPYRVVYSERVRNGLRELLDDLTAQGLGRQSLEVLKNLDARLHLYPQFGEPLRDLSTQGQTFWAGTVPPFVVHYIIDEPRRLVFVVKPFMLLPRV